MGAGYPASTTTSQSTFLRRRGAAVDQGQHAPEPPEFHRAGIRLSHAYDFVDVEQPGPLSSRLASRVRQIAIGMDPPVPTLQFVPRQPACRQGFASDERLVMAEAGRTPGDPWPIALTQRKCDWPPTSRQSDRIGTRETGRPVRCATPPTRVQSARRSCPDEVDASRSRCFPVRRDWVPGNVTPGLSRAIKVDGSTFSRAIRVKKE